MVSRLSAADASFYELENTTTPMYEGSLWILRKPRGGLGYEQLLATVEQRLPQIPRYRQKVREVTMGLSRPVWIDDREFDITYHVRRSALPSPGDDGQLHELIAWLAGQPLDKYRPLWEMHLIEGLAENRVAIYIKSHQALVSGMTALAIGHVIVDRTQRPPVFDEDIWVPRPEPGTVELVAGVVEEWVSAPAAHLRGAAAGVLGAGAGLVAGAGRKVFDTARAVVSGARPSSPLNTQVSQNRLFTVARGRLEDYRAVRTHYQCDVNDVVLAVIAGALRNWLLSRGEIVNSTKTVRAMAPLPVYTDLESTGQGQPVGAVTPFLVDLPVGEPNAVIRLSQIAYATESHNNTASLVDARTILTASGFAPPTLHAMGIRAATDFAGLSGRAFNLLVTNAPGTQHQMYVSGAKLLDTYNVPPLLHNQVLAIGVTSYNGMVYYGVNADRKAMSDVEMLPTLLDEALAELVEAAG
ncbi:MAG TPA: wax ester/triacylglycerol synthase family O-acyltransferase [Mycobacterium sp.]